MINQLIGYFDLQSDRRGLQPEQQAEGRRFPVVPQYVALVLGIVVQPFLAAFQKTGMWSLHGLLPWAIFSTIAGLIIFPAVYKKSFDPDGNLFVQLCTIFASGLGWQSLLQTAGKAGGIG